MVVSIEIVPLKPLGANKCPRCYSYHMVQDNFDFLCDRCCEVLVADWPEHPSIQFILESKKAQREKYGVETGS